MEDGVAVRVLVVGVHVAPLLRLAPLLDADALLDQEVVDGLVAEAGGEGERELAEVRLAGPVHLIRLVSHACGA